MPIRIGTRAPVGVILSGIGQNEAKYFVLYGHIERGEPTRFGVTIKK